MTIYISVTRDFIDLNEVGQRTVSSHNDIVPHEEDTLHVYERTTVFWDYEENQRRFAGAE